MGPVELGQDKQPDLPRPDVNDLQLHDEDLKYDQLCDLSNHGGYASEMWDDLGLCLS
jgi:hypothetical protein